MSRNGMRCDNPGCKKQVWKTEEAHGWLHLETLAAPDKSIYKLLEQGKTAKDPEVRLLLPDEYGGDFCSVNCVELYLMDRRVKVERERNEAKPATAETHPGTYL